MKYIKSLQIPAAAVLVALAVIILHNYLNADDYEVPEEKIKHSREEKDEKITTGDHSKYEILDRDFQRPEDLTAACLTCHVEAARQIMGTIHWTWVCPKNQDETIGKSTVINNFCMAMPSNEPRCTSCHVGYGWKDSTFDFAEETNVDCLVCHDRTGTYEKFPTGAGYPVTDTTYFPPNEKTYYPPDYQYIADNVGRPGKENCGTCHYFGGGGNKVKHGDLDEALNTAQKDLDVHMDINGPDFDCVTCHTTVNHRISGRCYEVPAVETRKMEFPLEAGEKNRIFCESCHSNEPHEKSKLNDHIDKVACQTCHIPVMAKANPTKMYWDWSEAGKFNEKGKPLTIKGKLEDGTEVVKYMGKKGAFEWGRNVKPEYFWYNGAIEATVVSDKINPQEVVPLNKLYGSYDDTKSRIYPFKVHRGKQPYDAANNNFVVAKLYGKKGSGAYWADFDWQKSIEAGMEYINAPYSGKYNFAETKMYWLVTHMVAPKEKSLACEDCHSAEESRLADLKGFYMPARDSSTFLDYFTPAALALTFLAVFFHGSMRYGYYLRKKKREKEEDEK